MPAHQTVPLAAKAYTLVSALAAGDTISVSAPPNQDLSVRVVAPAGAAPAATDPGDTVRAGEVAIYDGDGDVYAQSDIAVSIAVRVRTAA